MKQKESRNAAVLIVYESGRTFADIARVFGISGGRARQIVHQETIRQEQRRRWARVLASYSVKR